MYEGMNTMLLNKKCIYLGVSLFSALILGSMTTQSAKADTTTDATTTVKSSPTTTDTSTTAKTTAASTATVASLTTNPATTQTTVAKSVAPTTTVTQPIPTVKTVTTVAPVGPTSSTTTSSVVKTATPVEPTSVTTDPTATSSAVKSVQPISSTSTLTRSAAASPSGSTNTTGVTIGGYTIPTDTPTKDNTPNPAVSTTTPQVFPKIDYSLPTNLTASTPVPVSDANLASAIKTSMDIPATSPITVGDIQNRINSVMVQVNNGKIENLDGLQYMKLLPNNLTFGLSATLASDPTANPDLTPLDGLKLRTLNLTGDFSDPSAKEIDVNQIAKLPPVSYGMFLSGDKEYDGLTNAQLKVIAPWIIASSNINTPGGGLIENNGTVTDLSPLKGINRNTGFSLNITNGYYDPTPIYAVKHQPIVFKSTPVTGINGDDLASNYHFSASALPDYLTANNLKNLGNDEYELDNADTSAPLLIYGDPGFAYGAVISNITFPQYPGVQDLQNLKIAQPIIWQDHPNVTIDFVDANGKPIMFNGASSLMVNGNKIGDAFDLTAESKINGYTLTSPSTLLKGTYTQDPQTLTLTYKVNPTETSSNSNPSEATTVTDASGVLRTFNRDVQLVDASGDPIGKTASPSTAWKYSRIVSINGADYYQVASNEYLPTDSSVKFIPLTTPTNIVLSSNSVVYNSEGNALDITFPAGTILKTDGYAIINGVKMYRVGTDEWVSGDSTTTYESYVTVYTTKATTPVYNGAGQQVSVLPANTEWHVDRIVTINGVKYYRIATNEFILINQ